MSSDSSKPRNDEVLRLRLVAIKEQQRLNAAKLKRIARSK